MTPTGEAEARTIELGGERVAYQLYRSARRSLEISVGPGGVVEVRAPAEPAIQRIEQRLRARGQWIRRKIAEKVAQLSLDLPRAFVSGESHRYLGRQYRLRVVAGERREVRLERGTLLVLVQQPADRSAVRDAVLRWLRRRARIILSKRLVRLTAQSAFNGLRPTALWVRTMRTRWGSCSARGRLLLNPMLIVLPTSLIDYVIAHEVCHLRVPTHGPEFERLLGRVMPDWRERHRRLSLMRDG